MPAFRLEPLDTLFFRDGQPFHAGETGHMEVEGRFPPTPTALVGALRAALARQRGWDGSSNWATDPDLRRVLGDGPELGQARYQGPFLMRGDEALFPAPLLLMGKRNNETAGSDSPDKTKWHDLARLAAGDPLTTDQGALRLPQLPDAADDLTVLETAYLTAEGMTRVLDGNLPDSDHVIPQEALWHSEPRVGIFRDRETRTTPEDALYQSSHVRLCRNIGLGACIAGLPDGWAPASPAPLGGESRMAWIQSLGDGIALPECPTLSERDGTIRYTATLITPCDPTDEGWSRAGQSLFGLPGKIVSACVGKPQPIGGWDSLKHEPLPLRPHLPPGSTWFMEADSSRHDAIVARHGQHMGEHQAWGYGQILIGTWEEAQ
ncbi:MAG: type III-B CRISPR module-associated Cmr3 family protein [Salinibacter sp.]